MLKVEVTSRIRNRAIDILMRTGLVDDATETEDLAAPQELRADLQLDVSLGGGEPYTLFFEVKSSGNPRYALQAVGKLVPLIRRRDPGGKTMYGVFAAPFVSEASRQICREAGIGFVDLAGNCLLQFGDIYINIEGRPNPFPSTRPLKSLFSRKSSRVLRVLLLNPRKRWYVRDLARESGISLGQASNVKDRLLEYDFLQESKSAGRVRYQLKNPRKLLDAWAENYDYRCNHPFDYYSLDGARIVEERIVDYFNRTGIPYALTLTSGAARVAPYLRYSRAFAYVDIAALNVPPTMRLKNVAPTLGLKEVPTGPTVTLLQPYDEGVFYGLQTIGGAKVVSDVQLYLDLRGYKGRGEEAAEFILKNRLESIW